MLPSNGHDNAAASDDSDDCDDGDGDDGDGDDDDDNDNAALLHFWQESWSKESCHDHKDHKHNNHIVVVMKISFIFTERKCDVSFVPNPDRNIAFSWKTLVGWKLASWPARKLLRVVKT